MRCLYAWCASCCGTHVRRLWLSQVDFGRGTREPIRAANLKPLEFKAGQQVEIFGMHGEEMDLNGQQGVLESQGRIGSLHGNIVKQRPENKTFNKTMQTCQNMKCQPIFL